MRLVTWQWKVWLQCSGYSVYSRLFNLSFNVSIAMVPVVDPLLCSLASSHYFLVNIVKAAMEEGN